MADGVRQPTVVTMPDEIDIGNSLEVYDQLCAAVVPEGGIVVVDLTGTTFCDSSCVRELYHAYEYAREAGTEMRLVVPPGPVMRVFQLVGLDQVLPIYPMLAAALRP